MRIKDISSKFVPIIVIFSILLIDIYTIKNIYSSMGAFKINLSIQVILFIFSLVMIIYQYKNKNRFMLLVVISLSILILASILKLLFKF
jgi:hypothetical protein